MTILAKDISSHLAQAHGGTTHKTVARWLRDLQDSINLGDVSSAFTSGDATPSVLDNSKFITAGATAITNFDDGVEGQIITVMRGSADIEITDNANIDPIIAGNLTLSAARPSASFRLASGVWKQIEEAGAQSTAMLPVVQSATIPAALALLGAHRFKVSSYTPAYNLSSAHVEGGASDLSVQFPIDMGDITLPSGADKQHCVMRFIGTARNEDVFETAGARFISMNMNSYNADAYLVIGSVTLKTGTKEVKGLYGRAILESADGGAGVGLVGGVTISHANGDAAWALQLTVDGTSDLTDIHEQQFINLGTDQVSKTAGYAIASRSNISYNNAFIRAFNAGAGAFLQWDAPDAGGAGVHHAKFKVLKSGQVIADLGSASLPSYAFTSAGTDDANSGVFSPAADTVAIATAGSERIRVDSSGRTMVRLTANVSGDVFEVLNNSSLIRATANATGAIYSMRKTRSTTPGSSWTVLQDNDFLGEVLFWGDDGDSFINGAAIKARVDGSPSNNNVPTELEFYTSTGGTLSLQARITTAGDFNLESGNVLRVAGVQVIGAQGAAVADASGGATVDAEARTAINTFLARARSHGLIAT